MRPRHSLVARVILISLPVAVLPTSLGIASPLFPNQEYVVGQYASTILVADFNDDGIQDFAVAGSRPDTPPVLPPIGRLDVFLGKSDGSFAVTWGFSVL